MKDATASMLVSARGLVPTVLVSLALIALFVVSGAFTHRYVSSAVADLKAIHDTRTLAAQTLTAQLDEETGIRGYAATGDRQFLDPYWEAKGPLAADFGRLQADLAALPSSSSELALLAVARHTSARWTQTVAAPTLDDPKKGALKIQLSGKRLMDLFRGQLRDLDGALASRESDVSGQLDGAVNRITSLVAVAAALLSIAAIGYALQQMRAAGRIAAQQRVAETERRQRAEVQAAYEAEKRIADRLQSAFSQRPLPALETMRFSASYVPATEDTKLGGDWYDVIALPGNRALFTIGDVTGHGIEAAVTMNRARQSFVSGALFDADPGSVLTRVNDEMVAREDRLVTAIAGTADATRFEFVYAVAGHPPPVLLEPGRPPRILECGSLPLGGFPGTEYAANRLQSVPGATLVLYTDGAVEHSRDVIEGERLLLKAIENSAEHPEVDPATWIHREIFAGRAVGDDVAILTIGFGLDPALGVLVSADKAQSEFAGRLPRAQGGPAPAGARLVAA